LPPPQVVTFNSQQFKSSFNTRTDFEKQEVPDLDSVGSVVLWPTESRDISNGFLS
jgi:hypothetical protein